MTQEDKQLLLKDLCARLPYGVICKSNSYRNILFNSSHISLIESEEIKPYLRPMSSMTLEELEEFRRFGDHIRDTECKIHIANYKQTDWLNAHHFDYRGLIPKGLAFEVTKENNPYKN